MKEPLAADDDPAAVVVLALSSFFPHAMAAIATTERTAINRHVWVVFIRSLLRGRPMSVVVWFSRVIPRRGVGQGGLHRIFRIDGRFMGIGASRMVTRRH